MAAEPGPTTGRQKNVNDTYDAWGRFQYFATATWPAKSGNIDNLAYLVGVKRGIN